MKRTEVMGYLRKVVSEDRTDELIDIIIKWIEDNENIPGTVKNRVSLWFIRRQLDKALPGIILDPIEKLLQREDDEDV
jgi:hypothetical protein